MELASQLTAREAIEFFLAEHFDDGYQDVKEADEGPRYFNAPFNVHFTEGENGSIIGHVIWNNGN